MRLLMSWDISVRVMSIRSTSRGYSIVWAETGGGGFGGQRHLLGGWTSGPVLYDHALTKSPISCPGAIRIGSGAVGDLAGAISKRE